MSVSVTSNSFYVESYAGRRSVGPRAKKDVIFVYPKKFQWLKDWGGGTSRSNNVFFLTLASALSLHFLSLSIVLYCSNSFIRNGGFDDIVTDADSVESSGGGGNGGGDEDATTDEFSGDQIVDKIVSSIEAGTISRLEFGFCDRRSVYYAWSVFFIVGGCSFFFAALSGFVRARDFVMCHGRSDLLGCYEKSDFVFDKGNINPFRGLPTAR